jgi:hypothetical protein
MAIYGSKKKSNDKLKKAQSVQQKREAAYRWMAGETVVWDTCRRFVDGLQYGRYQEGTQITSGTWVTEPSEPGVSRVTVNLLLPIYNRLFSMLSVVTPYIGVRPASMTTEDMIKAKTDAAMVQYLWEARRVPEKFAKANPWMIVTGNAFMHPYYCAEKEQIEVDVIPPYDVFCQQDVDDIQQSEWLIKRSYLYGSAIERVYPKVDLSKVDAVSVRFGQDRLNFTYATDYSKGDDRYEVLEYWSREEEKHCIVIGSQIAWEAKKWDGKSEFPIVHFRFHTLPGRLHGKGAIAPLLQIQKEYNAQRSAIITNIRRMGNLQWIVANNSGVDQITNTPGAIIRYNPSSMAPKQLPLNPLPGYVLDNVNRSHSEMLDLAGIHASSLGKRVTGIESGKAINALVNQDESQLQGVLDSIEKGARDLSRLMLGLAKKHYSKRRMIRAFNQDGGMFFKMVKGTDLSYDPDVFFEASSLFKSHIAEREKRAVELAQLGLLTPEEARKAISFFGQDAMIHQSVRNYNYALDLLEAAISGDDVMVLPSDPVKEIVEVFQEYTTSEAFQETPEEIQANIQGILISVLAQGNPQMAQQLAQPIYPLQQPQPQQQPQAPPGAANQGGTAEGAAQRAENQQMGKTYENFDARDGSAV